MESTQEEKNWAILAHVTNAAGTLLSMGLLAWAGPLFIMLAKGPESRLVSDHSRETLNWAISLMLFNVALWIITVGSFFLLWPFTFVAGIIGTIIGIYGGIQGGLHADRGEFYRYPFSFRFLKG